MGRIVDQQFCFWHLLISLFDRSAHSAGTGRGKREDGRAKMEEGRGMGEEGRVKREDGRGKMEEGKREIWP